jgi:hypothetical protein
MSRDRQVTFPPVPTQYQRYDFDYEEGMEE